MVNNPDRRQQTSCVKAPSWSAEVTQLDAATRTNCFCLLPSGNLIWETPRRWTEYAWIFNSSGLENINVYIVIVVVVVDDDDDDDDDVVVVVLRTVYLFIFSEIRRNVTN